MRPYTGPCVKGAKGQAIIEMIFGIIMFTVLLTVILSTSVYLYIQHAIVTAAREGARVASLNTNLGSSATASTGEDTVVDYVKDLVASTAGITLSDSDIDVTPPSASAPIGSRTVQVTIDYELTNPIPIEQLLSGLSGHSYGLGTIPVYATAVMRYEE